MNRKIIAIIVLGLVLLACLLSCGYFGMKTIRRTQLRRAGMTAYEKKEYVLAERLLQQYVAKDPNAEAEYVALANIYHEFGNTGMEAQMWQTASNLNPLKAEYYENMLNSAIRSASYPLLHSILGRKFKMGEKVTDQELYLFVISSYRAGYQKDGDDAYKKAVKADPEAFHKNELGRMAEFMFSYNNLSDAERNEYLNRAVESEDPEIRFEALYIAIRRAARQDNDEMYEELLKKAVEANHFAGTPLLADYYASKYRFSDVLDLLGPYLKTIDDINLYLMDAECCVFEHKIEDIQELKKKLSRKTGTLRLLVEYCDILLAYLENDEEKLTAATRKSGKLLDTPLFRFIRLRVAISNNSVNEVLTAAREVFSSPPFYDLSNRALLVCLDYISREMKKTENMKDPSQMAELANILSGYLQGNPMLTEIIILDQYKKGLAKETELMAALDQFPDDPLIQRVTAEYLILNGKAEQAMSIIEPIQNAAENQGQELDHDTRLLYLLALDQLGRRDEATKVFQRLLEQTELDVNLLSQYLQYCVDTKREEDLISMADKLDTVKEGNLKHLGKFFRAAALLATEDESKIDEALDLLESAPDDEPDFTFYAANRLCNYERLDAAEAKYNAILKSFHTPSLVYVNLSTVYHAKGDQQKALETAKAAYDVDKETMLPAFIYAKRLSEAGQYEEAVAVLNFPRRTVNYRSEIVELWADCMRKVIEKNIASEKYQQAEEQCKHLLVIVPEDEFGEEKLDEVRKLMRPKTGQKKDEAEAAAS